MEASTCVRDRDAFSTPEGISTSTSLAGLLSFSLIHTASTLSLGDHWKVWSPSNLNLRFFPSSSLIGSKFLDWVSRTLMLSSSHSAKYRPSALHRKWGKSLPRGATDGVLHLRTHSPVKTRKIRTAFSSASPFHVRRKSSLGEKSMCFTDSCAKRIFFMNSGPAQSAMPSWWYVAKYVPQGDHCVRQSHQIFLLRFSRSPP
mmetsp:Transcript_69375/g.195672  ORF Transcript_69375/g.195672 Transcript_69375/m.195672 type:complete len:201 (+) Transcript_69375:1077-1679(+)